MILVKNTILEIKFGSYAKIAGIAYLVVFFLGTFANFFVFEKLIISGNVVATIDGIVANGSLFRLGISSWFVVIMCDALIAWVLYIFLSPVNKDLALLAALFRIVFVAIFAYSFTPYLSVLHLLNAEFTKVLEIDQLQAQTMLLLNEHDFGTHIAFIFFGLHILVIGYLIVKSEYVPRIIGIMLIVAALGYLVNSFGNFLSQDYSENKAVFFVFVAIPAFLSELSLTIWLLVRGGKLRL